MKRGQSVTLQQRSSAAYDVQRELHALGLWNERSRLADVEVVWCRIPQITIPDALGFYVSECSWLYTFLGYEPGNIYIPQWVLSHGFRQERGSLRDILRHEYGHALAFRYPKLVRRSKKFREAFGAHHDVTHDGGMWDEHGYEAFVSNYATTCPSEDFAETFTWWVRCRGRRPSGFSNNALRRKWKFVTAVAAAVSR